MGTKAKAAGQFFGGILNNPFVALLLLGLGIVLIFRGDIRKGFAGIGEGFGNIDITLPEIKFPEITFPEFKFPALPDFTSIFSGFQNQIDDISGQVFKIGESVGEFGAGTTITKEGIIEGSPPTIESTTGQGTDPSTLFGELRPKVFDTLTNLGFEPAEAFGFLKNVTTIEGLNQVLQSVNAFGRIQDETPMIDIEVPQDPTGFIGAFSGSGGFVGGGIFETPIANLSLSQIIDKFNVTASQAANIQAIAKDDFGDFDFGTNTGAGIGSVFPSLSSILPNLGAVSDPQFSGLSATEIANILTGGNIQNF